MEFLERPLERHWSARRREDVLEIAGGSRSAARFGGEGALRLQVDHPLPYLNRLIELPLPGEAKPDWQIVSEVAGKLGYGEAFAYSSAADIFREHAALSGYENAGTRDFDIGGLASISDAGYDALAPR